MIEKDSTLKSNSNVRPETMSMDTVIVNAFGNLIRKSKYQNEVISLQNLVYDNLFTINKNIVRRNIELDKEKSVLQKNNEDCNKRVIVLTNTMLNKKSTNTIILVVGIVSVVFNGYFILKK